MIEKSSFGDLIDELRLVDVYALYKLRSLNILIVDLVLIHGCILQLEDQFLALVQISLWLLINPSEYNIRVRDVDVALRPIKIKLANIRVGCIQNTLLIFQITFLALFTSSQLGLPFSDGLFELNGNWILNYTNRGNLEVTETVDMHSHVLI